jgi:tubulin monoglycylase TTLL3/8
MCDGIKSGNRFEIFGFDIMLDEQCCPWLIEVNSSPSMEYSTPITERLVKMV